MMSEWPDYEAAHELLGHLQYVSWKDVEQAVDAALGDRTLYAINWEQVVTLNPTAVNVIAKASTHMWPKGGQR